MLFPIQRHPGTTLFVDDDINFLSALEMTLPADVSVKTFAVAKEFLEHLAMKTAVAKDMDAYHRGAMDRLRHGGSVALEVMRFWNAFPERYALPQTVVIDYHMPVMNGIQALEKVGQWTGNRVLLTGVADEAMVCRAFNDRIIDYYIPKQNAKLMQQITAALKLLRNNHTQAPWAAWNAWYMSIRPEQELILHIPEVTKELFAFVGETHEHVVIGEPFGVLALGYEGGVKWLQLETTSTLDAAADLLVEMNGAQDDTQAVRSGRSLTDARIRKALRMGDTPVIAECQFQLSVPNTNEMLYGAVFDISGAGAPPAQMCYSAWLARQ